ncbi:hypothetical protein RUM44_003790 [Polyplax serrata]|uniref:Ubiquinone biosynthesis protein n=1 Tax=Polyplax serrata TaxID=468196 RepID=A0ABR1B0Y1_POLSC
MASRSQVPEKFIEEVLRRLEANDFSAAVNLFESDKNQTYLKNNCWDLIPELCKNITKEAKEKNEGLATCSESLLCKLAAEANPEEAVLEFLDQMDEADPVKFDVILKLLKILLCRDMSQRLKSLEWTLNSIRSYVEQFSNDEMFGDIDAQENEENLSNDAEIAELINIMNSIILFYEHFANKVTESQEGSELQLLITSRVLQMFDILLPYVKLESVPSLMPIKLRMQTLILELISNPMILLEFLFYRAMNVMKPKCKSDEPSQKIDLNDLSVDNISDLDVEKNLTPFEDTTIISDLAYGMFFYSLLSETEHEQSKLPMVYNPKYIMLSLIYVTVPFFEKKRNITISNGLNFLNILLNKLCDTLERSDLYFSSHKAILIHLNNIMIFSQNAENRKLALTCFKKYINCFDWEGRYFLLLRLRSHVTHPGTLGFLTVLLKEFVSSFMDIPVTSQTHHKFVKYYRGKLLFDIIKQYCFLTDGSGTDLVENADHIISALNALLYLIIRDKKNVTDIKRFIKRIKIDFLNPLKDGVSKSRTYYKMKLKELESDEKGGNSSKGSLNGNTSEVELQLSVNRLRGFYRTRYYCIKSEGTGNQNDKESEDQQYDSNIREKILSASLQFVPSLGWSKDAISNGAQSLGYPGIANGIFPNGGADLINYFYVRCNQKLKDHMMEITSKPEHVAEPKEFIKNSVEFRLRMIIPYIKKWPQAIAIMSSPPNVPVALANLLALSDDICFFAGDKSVDFNWYIRRIGVSGIYKVTELYMIQDQSTDFEETWKFLDRRLTEAVQVQQMISSGTEATTVAKDVVSAAFTTARNILHLNDPR